MDFSQELEATSFKHLKSIGVHFLSFFSKDDFPLLISVIAVFPLWAELWCLHKDTKGLWTWFFHSRSKARRENGILLHTPNSKNPCFCRMRSQKDNTSTNRPSKNSGKYGPLSIFFFFFKGGQSWR